METVSPLNVKDMMDSHFSVTLPPCSQGLGISEVVRGGHAAILEIQPTAHQNT